MGAAALQNGEVLGTAQSPVYTQQLEPTFKAQFWRTLRTLGTAFIVLSGIGALADERGGISRGIMGGDSAPKPTPETKTKFKDVKGVDEAKGELVEIVEYLRSPAKFTERIQHHELAGGPLHGNVVSAISERSDTADKF